MLTVFAAVAELEREYILQRQREGIAIAKQQGKYTGRKPLPVPDNFKEIVAADRPARQILSAVHGRIRARVSCVQGTIYRNTKTPAARRVFEAVEKLCFSNSLSIETTLSIESAAVCARLSGTLASGLYKNPRACRGFL